MQERRSCATCQCNLMKGPQKYFTTLKSCSCAHLLLAVLYYLLSDTTVGQGKFLVDLDFWRTYPGPINSSACPWLTHFPRLITRTRTSIGVIFRFPLQWKPQMGLGMEMSEVEGNVRMWEDGCNSVISWANSCWFHKYRHIQVCVLFGPQEWKAAQPLILECSGQKEHRNLP